MTELGETIRETRRLKGLNRGQLAERAQALPGAPEITELQVQALERGRGVIKLYDRKEPLPWVLRALGLGGAVVLRALGLGGKEAA